MANWLLILKISVQYRIVDSKVYEAFYELDDPHGQIASYKDSCGGDNKFTKIGLYYI